MRVVVVGAGYAGVMTANRLARKVPSAQVTVINPRPEFVERVRLHQRLAGTSAATRPLASMLRRGITPLVGTVDKIGAGSVALVDGERVDFDYAVLAVGSTGAPMAETVPVGSWEGAEDARRALAALPAGGAVAVVGGGPTGIETAAEVAEARPDLRVRLIGSAVAAGFAEGARRRVRAGLERLAVDIVDDEVTAVVDGVVRLRSGAAVAADLALWAIVDAVPDLAARSGLAVDRAGRALVDEFLRSVSDDRVFVVGDCAAVPGSRPACYTAQPQGIHAANTLARLVTGRTPRPYSLGYFALAVSLGRRDSVGQFTRRDDTPRRAFLAGRTMSVLREGISRGASFGVRTGGRGVVWTPSAPK